jgi:hypothetical protein
VLKISQPPALDSRQRRAGYDRSLELRRSRVELKRQLSVGQLDLVEAFYRDEAQGMKVHDLLRALPKVGYAIAASWLERAGINPARHIAQLGRRQQEALLATRPRPVDLSFEAEDQANEIAAPTYAQPATTEARLRATYIVRNARLPDISVVLKLLADGMSNRQIGERYEVSGEAVRLALKRHGVQLPRLRNNHAQYIPWHVRSDHANDALVCRLRIYSKHRQGIPLSERDQKILDDFEAFMNGANVYELELSVHYDRTDLEGFWLAPKVAGDRDYIHAPKNPRSR